MAETAGIILGGAGIAIALGDLIADKANRTVMIYNEDDHPIQFECCQKGESRGKHFVQPGHFMRIDFVPNGSTCWWCNAWFNGTDQPPMAFQIWKGHGSSKRYTVRKRDGIYKAEINGSKEHVHVKFNF